MNFDPSAANTLIVDGEYDAEIKLAEETRSKAGARMMKLTVNVWAGAGGPRTVFDYAVVPSTLWKLEQICAALDLTAKFKSGTVHPGDIMGKALRVAIKTQKDRTGSFPDKNIIARYLAAAAGRPLTQEREPGSDDDIAF